MTRVVTLGEVMLRLKSPGFERMFQSSMLEATFGGAEANVAASLAQFGVDARFVSAIPANNIGDACIAQLRSFGVDTSMVKRQGERLGVYFLENGANQRPSRVTYDRAGSSISTATASDFDWDAVFDGADWFHISGVTPAISASAAALSLDAARAAREKGLTVSCDYNYRKNLWRYGKKAPEVMRELVAYAHVGIANEEDCQKALGIEVDVDVHSGYLGRDKYRCWRSASSTSSRIFGRQIITLRESHSADRNGWSAGAAQPPRFSSRARSTTSRTSSTASVAATRFAAGVIYGLRAYDDDLRALEFATAHRVSSTRFSATSIA
jgi:2-dehydro-3-deoxygluconokinase